MLNEEVYEEEFEDENEDEDLDVSNETDENEDEIVIDEDDGWEIATYEDCNKLRVLKTPRQVKIIVDAENKKYGILMLRDLTIEQQFKVEEAFIGVKKDGLKLNLADYYRTAFEKIVVGANPKALSKWKNVRHYNSRSDLWTQIKKELPNPYRSTKSPSGLNSNDRKN